MKSSYIKATSCFLYTRWNTFLRSEAALQEAVRQWAPPKQVFGKQGNSFCATQTIFNWALMIILYSLFFFFSKGRQIWTVIKHVISIFNWSILLSSTHRAILCPPSCKLHNSGSTTEILKTEFNHGLRGLSIPPSHWSYSNLTKGISNHQMKETTSTTLLRMFSFLVIRLLKLPNY